MKVKYFVIALGCAVVVGVTAGLTNPKPALEFREEVIPVIAESLNGDNKAQSVEAIGSKLNTLEIKEEEKIETVKPLLEVEKPESVGKKPDYDVIDFSLNKNKDDVEQEVHTVESNKTSMLENLGIYTEVPQVLDLPDKEVVYATTAMGISKEKDMPYRPAIVGDRPLAKQIADLIAEREAKEDESINVKLPDVGNDLPEFDKLLALGKYEMTAYDLSVGSTGKRKGDKGYGITASGVNMTGLTREQARAVAVDPNLIPLGSELYIVIPEPYASFTGYYRAVDTGSAIKKNIIDLFMGDFDSETSDQSVWDFGRQIIDVYQVL